MLGEIIERDIRLLDELVFLTAIIVVVLDVRAAAPFFSSRQRKVTISPKSPLFLSASRYSGTKRSPSPPPESFCGMSP